MTYKINFNGVLIRPVFVISLKGSRERHEVDTFVVVTMRLDRKNLIHLSPVTPQGL